MANYLDPSLFDPKSITPETKAINDAIVKAMTGMQDWWIAGAQKVRDARARGDGPFPLAPKSDRARMISIKGKGGDIPLRVIAPEKPAGVYLHIHGGGFVLGACDQQDPMLERIVRDTGMACVSVEYRLAPEHPYPAGPDDCESAALWLVEHARKEFGTDKLTIGGESAGGNLSAVTLLRMRDRHGYTGFKAANLVFGGFDNVFTPSARAFGNERLVLRTLDIEKFIEAYIGDRVDRRDPDVSPLHADLKHMPRALFTIGTRDALLDDSLFMHARWVAAGNKGDLAVYPGGAHGFTAFPGALAASAHERINAFLKAAIA